MRFLRNIFNKFNGTDAQKALDAQLREAAAQGDSEAVTPLLNDGANVNAPDDKNRTALYFAAAAGAPDLVELFLNLFGKPNVGQDGDVPGTPLTAAAKAGYFESVKLLVGKGAKLEATGYERRTALHEALYRGHEDIAIFLAEAGTNPNTKDRMDTTPLQEAFAGDMPRAAIALIAHGADVNIDDKEGFPLRQAAVLKGWQNVVDEIDRPAREAAEALARDKQFAADLDKASILQSVLTIRKPLVLKGP